MPYKIIVFLCLLVFLNACGIGRYHSLHLIKGDDIVLKKEGKIIKKFIIKSEETSLNNSNVLVTKMDSLKYELLEENNIFKVPFIGNNYVKEKVHNYEKKRIKLISKKEITKDKYFPIKVEKPISINWLFLILSIALVIIFGAYLYFAIPFLIYWGYFGLIALAPAVLVLLLLIKSIKLI